VAPYSWCGEDDRVLFTMPLVHGGSVATLLGDFGALPIGWTIELLRQTLWALAAVHEAGVVHRDVKPGNLLLEATGVDRPWLRLSDFGAAAQLEAPRLTRADTVIGTPGYFAPEQLRGADPAPAQDVYAAAVVALQMLTGHQPSATGELPRPALEGTTGAGLLELLDAMTAAEPSRRPAGAAEALARLDALPGADDLGLGADPGNPVEVFDHVPELPTRWDAAGPASSDAPTPPPAARLAAPHVSRRAETPATVLLQRGRRVSETSPSPAPRRAPSPGRREDHDRSRQAAVALAVLGVVLILVAIVLELA
jgi:serine/threonine-protein kinase